jgi:uncharacterized protein YecE (DUF72 family)
VRWVPHIQKLVEDEIDVFGYVNKHYGGYAPDNLDQLTKMLEDGE